MSLNSSKNEKRCTQMLYRKSKHAFYVQELFSENRAVYGIMWNKCGTARQAKDDNKIRRMRFSCWIIKATDTHSEYVPYTYCFSTATIVTRMRLNVTIILKLPVLSNHCCCVKATIHSVYVTELHVIVNYTKIWSVAQQWFNGRFMSPGTIKHTWIFV